MVEHQSVSEMEPSDAILIGSRRNSNQIYVIDVEEGSEKEDNIDHESIKQCKTMTSRTGFRQISFPTFKHIPNLDLQKYPRLVGLLRIAIILGMAVLVLITTCWPQHNVILFPEYWYEPLPVVFVIFAYLASN